MLALKEGNLHCICVEQTLNYAQQEPNEPQEISDNYTQSSYMDDGTYRSQSELTRISREKEELEIQNKQLIDKHSELLTKYVTSPFMYQHHANIDVFLRTGQTRE